MPLPELKDIQALVDKELDRLLPPADLEPCSLHEAMRYSIFAGGKRFRPAIVMLSSRCCGGSDETALPPACALEMIHTYSLIHDDLPAMDDDDMRRGKPSCHKKFGEATAILAGDALLTLAFETVASYPEIVTAIARGSGGQGMIAGQAADLEAEGSADAQSLEELKKKVQFIHMHKTAALIRTSARCGAIAAGASDEQITSLTRYGECVGLAFQITDDILDVAGTQEEMGKAVGKDIERGKLIHPAVFGLEESRANAEQLVNEAEESLKTFGETGIPLAKLARFVLERRS